MRIYDLNCSGGSEGKQLFEGAEDIEEVSAEDAVEARAAGGEAVSEYSFKAPASAFRDAEDLGDADVDFEATIDGKGYLTRLTLHGEAEWAGATVTETYEDIDQDLHIRPPTPSELQGTVQRIDSKEEFEALIGGSP